MPSAILYFGSFSPVHNGHIALAEAVSKMYKAEVWFVLSPQNPFKQDRKLWNEKLRAHLLQEALRPHPTLRFCDAELHLPKPSYTIKTLKYLQGEHPGTDFMLLMGQDNLAGLHRWKAADEIMNLCRVLVYPRKDAQENAPQPDAYPILERFLGKIDVLEKLPLLDISSTQIRKMMAENKDVSKLVPWKVSELERFRP